MISITKYYLASLLLLSLLLSGCAVNPVTGKLDFVLMTESQEVALGRNYHPQIVQQYGFYDDAALQGYVNQIGQELAAHSHRKHLDFHFTVLDSPQINAFALPGGYIYITRGIMAYLGSEAELAGVLGHEIGHVTARHGVRQQSASTVSSVFSTVIAQTTNSKMLGDLSNTFGGALVSGYGRSHELQADGLGAEYLAQLGYNTANMIKVIGVLKDQETFAADSAKQQGRQTTGYHGLFSTHPRNDTRLQEVIKAAEQYRSNNSRGDATSRYLQKINNMTFGDSPQQGIIRNNHFYHPGLDIAIKLPQGWQSDNQAQRLLLVNSQQNAMIQLTAQPVQGNLTARQYLAQLLKDSPAIAVQSFTVNQLPASTQVSRINIEQGQRLMRHTVVLKNQFAYLFTATAASEDLFKQFDSTFLNTAKSLHKMTRQEQQLATAHKIVLYKVKPGDKYASLAGKTSFTDSAEARLRLLNGQYPSGEPTAGQIIKLVQ